MCAFVIKMKFNWVTNKARIARLISVY